MYDVLKWWSLGNNNTQCTTLWKTLFHYIVRLLGHGQHSKQPWFSEDAVDASCVVAFAADSIDMLEILLCMKEASKPKQGWSLDSPHHILQSLFLHHANPRTPLITRLPGLLPLLLVVDPYATLVPQRTETAAFVTCRDCYGQRKYTSMSQIK
jgi:hypothetical protein